MLAIRATLSAGFVLLLGGVAYAQTETTLPAATPEIAAPAVAAPATLQIPAGTEIVVEILSPLSSRTSQLGQTFGLRLRNPVMVGDQIAIPAGTTGAGEVVDAAPAGLGGRPGKLVVSARYLELNGQRIRIRGMTLNMSGESMTNTSTAVSLMPVVGIVGPFIQGGNIEIPAGASADARIAVATAVPVTAQAEAPPAPDAVAAETTTPTTTEGQQ
jgi:hypothetical protein